MRCSIGVVVLAIGVVVARASAAGGVVACGDANACRADVDASGAVDFDDLLRVLAAWGPCAACPEDVDESGDVGFDDVLLVLSAWGPCPASGLRCLELAGRALPAYPFFETVRAVTAGTPVEIAIDPQDLDGPVTADVYVVAARNAEEWTDDPTLVDVRPGGAEEMTFDGATIEANTFTLAGSDALDGDGGIAFGLGYDLVCDVNRNGALDADDLVDGLGAEAAFTVVPDTTAPGPLATTSITYSGGTWRGQRTYYPANVAAMGALPLVVISHGNGHQYTWYDYLGEHLASWGYVVMSHQNNTQPGIETASTTTLANTDYFLGNLDVIGGGVLDGHVDGHRITWIGHSRGGEGVSRAFDRLFDGDYVPVSYAIDDVVLVSSIAPNDYLGRSRSNPHEVNYHLLHGAADGDNGGWPDRESDAPFHVYERAEGYRQVTHVHGADHNDFNCCGWNDFQGPAGTQIGRAEAQRVAKAAYLALIKHYVDGSEPAKDFLWRQYEVLRPIGVAPSTIVVREYVEGPSAGNFVIDDFQSEPSLAVSSSGGGVTGDAGNRFEGRHDDTDGTFTWSPGDPMNGMSRGRVDDVSRGSALDWSPGPSRFLEFEVLPAARDMTRFAYLGFRAGQGTRHPETVAELEDLSFTVTLRDGAGATSSIDFGAYGAGLQEPYQRTGSGSGVGWQVEYETIRIRLADFRHDASGLDLTDVVAVRFDLGASFGSSRGRITIDDLVLSADVDPAPGPPAPSAPDATVHGRVVNARAPASDPDAPAVAPQTDSPTAVRAIVSARPFVLEEETEHLWRRETPRFRTGYLLVLEVDPSLVVPRQRLEPVLYVGRQTAERVNLGARSGRVIVIVPAVIGDPGDRAHVDLARAMIWFGTPELPERVDGAVIDREALAAAEAGIVPFPGEQVAIARRRGGERLHVTSRDELLRAAAALIETHAPDERELAEALLVPKLPSR